MRLQSATRYFVSSALLYSLVYTFYIPSPISHLPSTQNVAASTAVLDGDDSAMSQNTIGKSGSTIFERDNIRMPFLTYGASCGQTFYPREMIKEVAAEACSKLRNIQKSGHFESRQKIMSCAPNVPFCHYNFPHLYKGPQEFYQSKNPLYVWPIVTNRFRKFIGSKGNDRIVLDLQRNCFIHGLARKNLWGKWTKCKTYLNY